VIHAVVTNEALATVSWNYIYYVWCGRDVATKNCVEIDDD